MIKLYAILTGTLLVLGAGFGFWTTVHTKPMQVLNDMVISRDLTIQRNKLQIENLDANLTLCVKAAVATDFQSYFAGGGGIEEHNTSTSDNIFLKRVR